MSRIARRQLRTVGVGLCLLIAMIAGIAEAQSDAVRIERREGVWPLLSADATVPGGRNVETLLQTVVFDAAAQGDPYWYSVAADISITVNPEVIGTGYFFLGFEETVFAMIRVQNVSGSPTWETYSLFDGVMSGNFIEGEASLSFRNFLQYGSVASGPLGLIGRVEDDSDGLVKHVIVGADATLIASYDGPPAISITASEDKSRGTLSLLFTSTGLPVRDATVSVSVGTGPEVVPYVKRRVDLIDRSGSEVTVPLPLAQDEVLMVGFDSATVHTTFFVQRPADSNRRIWPLAAGLASGGGVAGLAVLWAWRRRVASRLVPGTSGAPAT